MSRITSFRKLQAIAILAIAANGVSGTAIADWESVNKGDPGYGQPSYAQPKPNKTVRQVVGGGVGAVIGGVIGNQFGGGSGRTLMTVAGALGGGFLGKAIATPKEMIIKDVNGREWKNGSTPIDPQTEAPQYSEVVDRAQIAYGIYVLKADAASIAKEDYTWQRLDEETYRQINREMAEAARDFMIAREDLNVMSKTIAQDYDREIPLDNLLVLTSCNTVPVGNMQVTSYQAIVEKGYHCSPQFKPNTGM